MQIDFLRNILQKRRIVIDESNILELCNGFSLRKIEKNNFFIREGDMSHIIAIVKSGLFCSYYIENSGLEVIKYFYPEESVLLSYYAYLTGQKSAYYIQALEESEIYVMELCDFKKLVVGNYQLLYLCKKQLDEILIMKEEHATSFTRLNSTERYIQFLNTHPTLESRVKQYQIASYLGITPVSLSRIRKKLGVNK
jgi:CRP-like cAMP-binding protein